MKQSRAIVFDGQPNQLEIRSFAISDPQAGECLVRIEGCTLCGSDLHSIAGRRQVPVPTILGHEIVGRVERIGDGPPLVDAADQTLSCGDRVTWSIVANCGQCALCRRGLPQKCLQAVKYGHQQITAGSALSGGLAEHCLLVAGTTIVRIPERLSLSEACPASCSTATAVAAIEAADSLEDRSVVVMGAGLLGLNACAIASTRGAASVICSEPDGARRVRALEFGATHAVEPSELAQTVKQATDGLGADVFIEMSGSAAALSAAWPTVRLGGQIVLVGSVFPGPPLDWTAEQLVRRNLTIHGIHNYAPRQLATAVEFLALHQTDFPFQQLVAHWYALDQFPSALDAARQPANLRIGIRP